MLINYSVPNRTTQKTKLKENKMETFAKAIGLVMIGLAVIVFVGLLLSLPVMWLWNVALVPAIPGLANIGWLQAWGIMILCGLLFKPAVHTTNKD